MTLNTKIQTYYQHNKEKVSQRSIGYYEKNEEKIKEDRMTRYSNLTNEEKKKLIQEKWKSWYCRLDNEKKNEIRNASRDRYYHVTDAITVN